MAAGDGRSLLYHVHVGQHRGAQRGAHHLRLPAKFPPVDPGGARLRRGPGGLPERRPLLVRRFPDGYLPRPGDGRDGDQRHQGGGREPEATVSAPGRLGIDDLGVHPFVRPDVPGRTHVQPGHAAAAQAVPVLRRDAGPGSRIPAPGPFPGRGGLEHLRPHGGDGRHHVDPDHARDPRSVLPAADRLPDAGQPRPGDGRAAARAAGGRAGGDHHFRPQRQPRVPEPARVERDRILSPGRPAGLPDRRLGPLPRRHALLRGPDRQPDQAARLPHRAGGCGSEPAGPGGGPRCRGPARAQAGGRRFPRRLRDPE